MNFASRKNIEIEYCTQRIHTGTGAVERAIQTTKNLILANLEDEFCLTECVNRALKVMRFTIHTGLKLTPFELHHGGKPRTEITNLVKNGQSFLSDWTELSVPAEKNQRSQSIYRETKGGCNKLPGYGENQNRRKNGTQTEKEKFG